MHAPDLAGFVPRCLPGSFPYFTTSAAHRVPVGSRSRTVHTMSVMRHSTIVGARALGAACVFVVGCSADTADVDANEEDIRSGTLANTEQREVGIFLFPLQEGGQGRCTATLIGPRTAITAAHCVLPSSGPGPCTSGTVYLDTQGTGAPIAERVQVPVRACATPIADVRDRTVRARDIAVLALARKVTEIAQTATIATAVPDASTKLTVFGYGRTGASCTVVNPGNKYRSVVLFGNADSPTCKGDSGGPYFIGEGGTLTHQIVSLVSGETTSGGARVLADLVANKTWIEARRSESESGRALTDAR